MTDDTTPQPMECAHQVYHPVNDAIACMAMAVQGEVVSAVSV
jgi:hypothetical protein